MTAVLPRPPLAVVFDIDGTLLDSADGIVTGFAHALRSAGIDPPPAAVLRSDLGPPIEAFFAGHGLTADVLERAVASYRSYYLEEGIGRARAYPGVVDLLGRLSPRVPLATATAKRPDTAAAILSRHGLAHHFSVIAGTPPDLPDKADTLAAALRDLGSPDPRAVVMVGDRHSDIAAGLACGTVTVGVTWGYGSAEELRAAGAHVLVERPADLAELLLP